MDGLSWETNGSLSDEAKKCSMYQKTIHTAFFCQNVQKYWIFCLKLIEFLPECPKKLDILVELGKKRLKVMHSILRFAETAYIETHTLLPLLQDYQNPRDYLSRLVKKGDLIRLRNGFYLIAEKIEKSPAPFEQIANLLHGPSYLSFEWALAYYGMIPEGVYVVTSASMVRAKNYKTVVGTFEYTHLSRQRYAIGIDQQENAAGRFLIATPEKALVDFVQVHCSKLERKDLLIDLIEGRRIDESVLKNLNKQHLVEIAERYRSQSVNNLTYALGLL